MGTTLNWTSNYPDSVDNFPTLQNNVHNIMTSHVNALASSLVAVEEAVDGLIADGAAATVVTIQVPIQNGEAISVGQAVAASATSGRCRRAVPAANAAPNFLGICLAGGMGDVGGSVMATIAVAGLVSLGDLALTANTAVYLDPTSGSGAICSGNPTLGAVDGDLILRIGFAISPTQFVIHVGEGAIRNVGD